MLMNNPARDPDSDEQVQREEAVTAQVLASFARTDRLGEVLRGLVTHLHAFAREVRISQDELATAIGFLRRAGDITTDNRQEFILLSDVLGLSMLTVCMSEPADGEATESTVLGPFFVTGSPKIEQGGDLAGGTSGQPCWVEGRVTDTEGNPLRGALIEVWEADDSGHYDVQYDDKRVSGRGHLYSDDEGKYRFWCVRPTSYPIPHDGPVGDLLLAAGRGPHRAAHLHFMVEAPGHRTLITHIFVDNDPYLDRDAVFGVRESLITEFLTHGPEERTPDRRVLNTPWSSAHFDIVLARERDR